MISVSDGVENIVEKGENADYQHFLLFPQYFTKASLWGGGGNRKKLGWRGKDLTNIRYPGNLQVTVFTTRQKCRS